MAEEMSNFPSRRTGQSNWSYPSLMGALGDSQPEQRPTAPLDVQGVTRGQQDQGSQHSLVISDQGPHTWNFNDQASLHSYQDRLWATQAFQTTQEQANDMDTCFQDGEGLSYGMANAESFKVAEHQQEAWFQEVEAPTSPAPALAALIATPAIAVDTSSLWGRQEEPAKSAKPGLPTRWEAVGGWGGKVIVPDPSLLQSHSKETSTLSSQSNSSHPSASWYSLPQGSGSQSSYYSNLDDEDEDKDKDEDEGRDVDEGRDGDRDCSTGEGNPRRGQVLRQVKDDIQLALVNQEAFPDKIEDKKLLAQRISDANDHFCAQLSPADMTDLNNVLRQENGTFRGHARDSMRSIVASYYGLHPDTLQENQETGKPWTQSEIEAFTVERALALGEKYQFLNHESGNFNHPGFQACIRKFLYRRGGLGQRFPAIYDTVPELAFIFVATMMLRCLDEKAACPHRFTPENYSVHYDNMNKAFQTLLTHARTPIDEHTPQDLKKKVEAGKRVEETLRAWAKPVKTPSQTDKWGDRGTYEFNWK